MKPVVGRYHPLIHIAILLVVIGTVVLFCLVPRHHRLAIGSILLVLFWVWSTVPSRHGSPALLGPGLVVFGWIALSTLLCNHPFQAKKHRLSDASVPVILLTVLSILVSVVAAGATYAPRITKSRNIAPAASRYVVGPLVLLLLLVLPNPHESLWTTGSVVIPELRVVLVYGIMWASMALQRRIYRQCGETEPDHKTIFCVALLRSLWVTQVVHWVPLALGAIVSFVALYLSRRAGPPLPRQRSVPEAPDDLEAPMEDSESEEEEQEEQITDIEEEEEEEEQPPEPVIAEAPPEPPAVSGSSRKRRLPKRRQHQQQQSPPPSPASATARPRYRRLPPRRTARPPSSRRRNGYHPTRVVSSVPPPPSPRPTTPTHRRSILKTSKFYRKDPQRERQQRHTRFRTETQPARSEAARSPRKKKSNTTTTPQQKKPPPKKDDSKII